MVTIKNSLKLNKHSLNQEIIKPINPETQIQGYGTTSILESEDEEAKSDLGFFGRCCTPCRLPLPASDTTDMR